MEDRESLNNILVDDSESNKAVSIKKVIFVGLVIFSLFIVAIFSMKYLNPSIKENKVETKKVETKAKDDDNNLFETLEVKQSSKVSDNFKNVIDNLKNKKDSKKETNKIEVEENTISQKNKAPKSIARKKDIKPFIQKGYYIQVGAFYRLTPSDELLDKVKKNGYSYVLFKAKINNNPYTKVVIGPYESKKEAILKLPDIKKIEPQAYILSLP